MAFLLGLPGWLYRRGDWCSDGQSPRKACRGRCVGRLVRRCFANAAVCGWWRLGSELGDVAGRRDYALDLER
jgi:hypothetical protein